MYDKKQKEFRCLRSNENKPNITQRIKILFNIFQDLLQTYISETLKNGKISMISIHKTRKCEHLSVSLYMCTFFFPSLVNTLPFNQDSLKDHILFHIKIITNVMIHENLGIRVCVFSCMYSMFACVWTYCLRGGNLPIHTRNWQQQVINR